MRGVIYVVIFVIAIIAGFLGIGLLLPATTHIEKQIDIDSSSAIVFSMIGDQQTYVEWSPWADIDPSMKVNFIGPKSGVGATYQWQGNEKVGNGSSTVTDYAPNHYMRAELEFGSRGTATTDFTLTEDVTGDGQTTTVVWAYDKPNQTLFERYIGLSLEDMIGKEMQRGLEKLKTLAENSDGIQTKEISYSLDGVEMKGFLAQPIGLLDAVPAVLVVHEWWGQNEHARNNAKKLAKLGYVAFALDMYGEGKMSMHPKDAGAFATEVGTNSELSQARFRAAMDTLLQQANVDQTKIAAIGYCFGGSIIINMARSGVPLNGVVSFHGGLGSLATIEPDATAQVLVLNGAADPMVPEKDIVAFKESMEKANMPYTFISYDNAKHAFTNPDATAIGEKFNLPLAYNAEADEKSWQEMQAYLKTLFFQKQ